MTDAFVTSSHFAEGRYMFRTCCLAILSCALLASGTTWAQTSNTRNAGDSMPASARSPRGLLLGLLGETGNRPPDAQSPAAESAPPREANSISSNYVRNRMGIPQQARWRTPSQSTPAQPASRPAFLTALRHADRRGHNSSPDNNSSSVGQELRQPHGATGGEGALDSEAVAAPELPGDDRALIRVATRPGHEDELALSPPIEKPTTVRRTTEVFTIVRVAQPHVLPSEFPATANPRVQPQPSLHEFSADVATNVGESPAETSLELDSPFAGSDNPPPSQRTPPEIPSADTSVETAPQEMSPEKTELRTSISPEIVSADPPSLQPREPSPVSPPPVLYHQRQTATTEPNEPAPSANASPVTSTTAPEPPPTTADAHRPQTIQPAEPRVLPGASIAPQPVVAPQLKVTITGPQKMNVGDSHACAAIIANTSTVDAHDVSVVILLNGERAQHIEVGQLPAGQQRKLDFELIPKQGGNLSVNAIATARSGVLALAKGGVTVVEYELQMQLIGPRQLTFGETVEYGLLIHNTGVSTAEDVVVNVQLGGSRLDGLYKGKLAPGEQSMVKFQVVPRKAGFQTLSAAAFLAGVQRAASTAKLRVQHGQLEIAASGPAERVVGEDAVYIVRVKNVGDAAAHNVLMTAHLPEGVLFKRGVEQIDFYDGVTWRVGTLGPGQTQAFQMHCELFETGQRTIEFTAQGDAGLKASHKLALTIDDPAGERVRITQPVQPELR